MAGAIPASVTGTCPRCGTLRLLENISGGGVQFRCNGCEWLLTMSAGTPNGTSNAAVTAGTTTAISVASGGASFTSGMLILYDTGSSAEIVTVSGTATATSIPVPGGFIKSHLTAATFGQLAIAPSLTIETVPPAPGWGF